MGPDTGETRLPLPLLAQFMFLVQLVEYGGVAAVWGIDSASQKPECMHGQPAQVHGDASEVDFSHRGFLQQALVGEGFWPGIDHLNGRPAQRPGDEAWREVDEETGRALNGMEDE